MKKIVVLALGFSFLASCNKTVNNSIDNSANQDSIIEETPSIGGNKDENGCLTGAGLTWSQLKQNCIQVFSEGLRLNPTKVNENEAIISSFVVFNDDKSKLELFLASEEKTTFVIDKGENNIYEGGIYKYDANKQTLFINGEEAYKAE